MRIVTFLVTIYILTSCSVLPRGCKRGYYVVTKNSLYLCRSIYVGTGTIEGYDCYDLNRPFDERSIDVTDNSGYATMNNCIED